MLELESKSIHYFLEKYQIKTSNGLPFEFHDRAFMWDIFSDMSPYLVILKPPQIGATETQIVKVFWTAKYKEKDCIYTLPTSSDVAEMASGKINRIIANNPIFGEWTKDKDSVEQKAIGKNIIYFRGTWTTRAAMMVSSQLNIHDEIDASNQKVIEQYETRLQAQAGGWKWVFSHPSVPGNGVDLYWQQSDMKEWFITCPHCKKEHFMEFPGSLDMEKAVFICKHCQGELSVDDRRKGRWLKKASMKEQLFSGYHITQMMCPWITAEKIIKDYKEKDPQYFYNFVLGLPYADTQSKVTLETIEKALVMSQPRKGRVIIGLDTGIDLRYVVGDMNGLFDYGEIKTYQDFERVMKRYPNSIVIADQGGDIIGIRELQEKYPGRVYLCYFQKDKQSMQLIKWGTKEEFGKVKVDRNRIIQLVVDELNQERIPIEGNLDKWYNYYLHWSHMYRIVEEDAQHNLQYIWERNDRNDWAIATIYWRIGVDRFGEQESYFAGGESKRDEVPFAVERDYKGRVGLVKPEDLEYYS